VSGQIFPISGSVLILQYRRLRDTLKLLSEIEVGQCGISSYFVPASRSVDGEGRVHALDKQPLDIKRVKEKGGG